MIRIGVWRASIEITGLALLGFFAVYPVAARATISGGGYSVQEQISIFGALVSGAGFNVSGSGQSQGGIVSGGGYSISGGSVSVVPVAASPSSVPVSSVERGDPGGGGYLFDQSILKPTAVPVPIAGLASTLSILGPTLIPPAVAPDVTETQIKPTNIFDVSVGIAQVSNPPLWRRAFTVISDIALWLFSWWWLWLAVITLILIWRKIRQFRR